MGKIASKERKADGTDDHNDYALNKTDMIVEVEINKTDVDNADDEEEISNEGHHKKKDILVKCRSDEIPEHIKPDEIIVVEVSDNLNSFETQKICHKKLSKDVDHKKLSKDVDHKKSDTPIVSDVREMDYEHFDEELDDIIKSNVERRIQGIDDLLKSEKINHEKNIKHKKDKKVTNKKDKKDKKKVESERSEIDDILQHMLCVKEQIENEIDNMPVEIEKNDSNAKCDDENTIIKEREYNILKNVDDLLKYIMETTEQLGRETADVGTETEVKDKRRKKKGKKIRWKNHSNDQLNEIIEQNENEADSIKSKEKEDVQPKYVKSKQKESEDLHQENFNVEEENGSSDWKVKEKTLIELNGSNVPISFEKIEILSAVDVTSNRTGDEEKPLGPLAVFSFLEVGVQPSQVKSTTPTGHHLLATGTILTSKEHGVSFPLVHMKEDDGTFEGYLNNGHKLDNSIIQQGLYREVRSICPEDELKEIKQDEKNNVAFIILGFKSLDTNFSQVMVDSWKDWTGARYIYMYLPDELGLARIRFYRREVPNGTSTIFTYLVIVECRNVDSSDKQMKLLEFARRLRVQKINSYISVYGISNDK